MQDWHLLQDYVNHGSEASFGKLVARHMNAVYSTCFRELHETQAAEDAAQAVFLLLSQKSKTLRQGTVLSGWLFNAARLVSANLRRSEQRRRARELKAAIPRYSSDTSATSNDLETHLNDAISSLARADRDVILLRFYHEMSLAEVGAELGIKEDAARMRLTRAVERMRRFLVKHGSTVSVVLLTGYLTGEAVKSAPQALAETTAHAIGIHGTTPLLQPGVYHLTQGAAKQMTIIKIKAYALGILLVAGGGAGLGIGRAGLIHSAQSLSQPRITSAVVTAPLSAPIKLPNGITVQLVGITNFDRNGDWWDANGTIIPDPADPSRFGYRFHNSQVYFTHDSSARTVCLKVQTDQPLQASTTGMVTSIRPQDYPSGDESKGHDTYEENVDLAPGNAYFGKIGVSLPGPSAKFSYRFGIATGPWQTIAVVKPDQPLPGSVKPGNLPGHDISIDTMNPVEIDYQDTSGRFHSQPVLPADQKLGEVARRIVALDKNGQEVKLEMVGAINGIYNLYYASASQMAQIAKICLQTRPFQWVDFKGIAFQPTHPTVEIPMPSPTPGYSQTINGVTVSLAAVSRPVAEGGGWWRPDGARLAGRVKGNAWIEKLQTYPNTLTRGFVYCVKSHVALNFSDALQMLEDRVTNGIIQYSVGTEDYSISNGCTIANEAIYAASKRTCVIRFGVSKGAWSPGGTVAMPTDHDLGLNRSNTSDTAKIVLQISDHPELEYTDSVGNKHVTPVPNVSSIQGLAHQFTAIMMDGSEKPIQSIFYHTSNTVNASFITLGTFDHGKWHDSADIDLTQVRAFRFETRPFQWATFSNVALFPKS